MCRSEEGVPEDHRTLNARLLTPMKRTRSHSERCRRAIQEETDIPNQPSTNIWDAQDGLSKKRPMPHTLSDLRGVPDRESNETKYLREATEMIEVRQWRIQRAHSVSHHSCEHSDVRGF